MPRPDNRYSRFIAMAKVALPIAALGLFSSLFLLSNRIDPTEALRETDIEELVRLKGVNAPRYSGLSSAGSRIVVNARAAQPHPTRDDVSLGEDIDAQINGATRDITVTAPRGMLDQPGDLADLMGGVRIVTSDGYTLETDTLHARLGDIEFESEGAVSAWGPLGEVDAGKMILTEKTGPTGAHWVLVLKNDVHLIYRPKR